MFRRWKAYCETYINRILGLEIPLNSCSGSIWKPNRKEYSVILGGKKKGTTIVVFKCNFVQTEKYSRFPSCQNSCVSASPAGEPTSLLAQPWAVLSLSARSVLGARGAGCGGSRWMRRGIWSVQTMACTDRADGMHHHQLWQKWFMEWPGCSCQATTQDDRNKFLWQPEPTHQLD